MGCSPAACIFCFGALECAAIIHVKGVVFFDLVELETDFFLSCGYCRNLL